MNPRTAILICVAALLATLTLTAPADAGGTPIDDLVDCSDAFWAQAPKCTTAPAPPEPVTATPFDQFLDCTNTTETDPFFADYCARIAPNPPTYTPTIATPVDKFVDCTRDALGILADPFWSIACGAAATIPG